MRIGVRSRLGRPSSLLLFAGGALLIFALSTAYLQSVLQRAHPSQSQNRLSLTDGWSYTKSENGRSPGSLPNFPNDLLEDAWKPFNPAENSLETGPLHTFARNHFSGRFWLRRFFEMKYPFGSPALVLGRVPGYYKAYLNNHLIGEGDGKEGIFSVFDQSLISTAGNNTLWIAIDTKGSPYPGFASLRSGEAFLGEFNDAKEAVTADAVHEALMIPVFFAICAGLSGCLLVFAISSSFSALGRRRRASDRPMTQNGLNPLDAPIKEIHEKTAKLLKASQSTLYIATESDSGQAWFEAISVVGDNTLIRKSRPIFEDLIGTACKARTPWLIRDIGEVVSFGSRPNYRSRSSIIIPLCVPSAFGSFAPPMVIGALTLADKESSTAFTDEDFVLALEAARELVTLFTARSDSIVSEKHG